MDTPPIDWFKQIADGKVATTGVNVWKALKFRAFIQVIGKDGSVISGSPRLDQVSHFRITERGRKLLDQSKEGAPTLPFNKADPPLAVRLWLSAFRRWCRNCPKGLQLTYANGQLHVLANDSQGKTADDDLHRLDSVKVPWHD
jgi:hypothetical protein